MDELHIHNGAVATKPNDGTRKRLQSGDSKQEEGKQDKKCRRLFCMVDEQQKFNRYNECQWQPMTDEQQKFNRHNECQWQPMTAHQQDQGQNIKWELNLK